MLAVYAGSFDPPTNGHVWMIEQGAQLFDQLVVAVGVNPDKSAAFGVDQRLTWLREITTGMPNVEVDHFENLFLASYAAARGGGTIIRGIRTEADYTYERSMRYINSDLHPDLSTVFLMPPRELSEVSSSAVKGMIGPDGWETIVSGYVPRCVMKVLRDRGIPTRE